MPNKSSRKGGEGERQAARILSEKTGLKIKRELGQGRKDDVGDLYGFPQTCIQVKNYGNGEGDAERAIRIGLSKIERQRENRKARYGVVMVRRYGGKWWMVMNIDNWILLMADAIKSRRRVGELEARVHELESLVTDDRLDE